MFSFDPVFSLPEWLQVISVIAMICGFQATTYALLNTRWGSIPAFHASMFAGIVGLILGAFLFGGL